MTGADFWTSIARLDQPRGAMKFLPSVFKHLRGGLLPALRAARQLIASAVGQD